MKARQSQFRFACRPGLTILELLTVVIIVAIVMALMFPALGALRRSTRNASGGNAIQAAVVAARAFATRDRDGLFVEIAGYACDPSSGCGDSGAAIVFTPSGDMRIVENTPFGVNQDGVYMELAGTSGYSGIQGRDEIHMPENLGVMGIARNGGVLFLSPPFAMRFDNAGHLIASNDDMEVVYYDGNDDGMMDTSRDRDNAFDPNNPGLGSENYNLKFWDPYEDRNNSLARHPDTGLWPLPFERLETVIGVVLYDKDALGDAFETVGPSFLAPDTDNDNQLGGTVAAWLMHNGNTLIFSRYSGTLISEREGS